jgi:glycosyltransferase involved in cell wall biosynthesis
VFRIVTVSRFAPYQKRQDVLIDALRQLQHTKVIVDFFGVGSTMESCRKRCQNAGIAERVTFHGFCDRKELAGVLAEADLFALPSDYEGLPKSMLEAMAVGTPCLVSDVRPLSNYVQDGITGYRAGNTPEEWASSISQIMRHRARSVEISIEARRFVERQHDADQAVVGYREHFATLTTGTGCSHASGTVPERRVPTQRRPHGKTSAMLAGHAHPDD